MTCLFGLRTRKRRGERLGVHITIGPGIQKELNRMLYSSTRSTGNCVGRVFDRGFDTDLCGGIQSSFCTRTKTGQKRMQLVHFTLFVKISVLIDGLPLTRAILSPVDYFVCWLLTGARYKNNVPEPNRNKR